MAFDPLSTRRCSAGTDDQKTLSGPASRLPTPFRDGVASTRINLLSLSCHNRRLSFDSLLLLYLFNHRRHRQPAGFRSRGSQTLTVFTLLVVC